jgi:hypothetical protein
MTTPADSGPTDIEGRTLPPYEGRRESADVADEERMRREGANVGGATGPVESDEMKAPEPADTPRGAVASPADEQPAADTPDGEPGEASVGPAHHPGTTRGEDVGEDDYNELGGES